MCQCYTDAPIFVCEKKSLYGMGQDKEIRNKLD